MSSEGGRSPPTSGSERKSEANLKQRRTPRSCDVCRQRKIRCDGPNMPEGHCSNCLAFGESCKYMEPARKRGPKNKQVEELKHRIATLEAELRSLSVCSLCAQRLQSQPNDTCSSDSAFRHWTPKRDTLNVTLYTDADRSFVEEENSEDELIDRFRRITIAGKKGKLFGLASSFVLMQSAIAVKEKYLGRASPHSRRPLYWEQLPWEKEVYAHRPHYTYPANDLITSLVELYFTNVHPTFPVLHRPSFERSVAEGLYLTDMKFGAALLAVLAVASRYSDDPRVLIDGNTLSSGWTFVTQLPIAQPFFEPTIHEAQFYCLMTLFSLGTSVPQMSWLYLGIGIRFIQHRGVHRRKHDGRTFKGELWNRAFWALFVLDRMVCSFLGRPPAIYAEE
ncbi:fungal-specific transcription factor domain-containing protein [Mycena galericulata]|nr:fungal-specific transcription factor domain-containing protein [Mycena galericulata]